MIFDLLLLINALYCSILCLFNTASEAELPKFCVEWWAFLSVHDESMCPVSQFLPSAAYDKQLDTFGSHLPKPKYHFSNS